MTDPSASPPRRIPALLVLLLAAAASFLAHVPFVIEGFGEGDAARLVNQAAGWHAAGELTIHEYTARVSPVYLHVLKRLLDAGVPLRAMPAIMNWTNAVLGSLTLLPLYWLFRQLAGPRAAAVACVLFWFAPAFWQANIYGMPHLPSFTFFVTAAALFHDALHRDRRPALSRFAGAALLMTVSCGLKADIVLCAAGILAIALVAPHHRRRNAVAAVAIVAAGAVAALLYSHLLVAPLTGSGAVEAGNWERRFPFTPRAVLDAGNRNRTILAVGPVLFLASAAAIVVAAIRRPHRRLLFVCAAWAAPPLLFWGLKMGNSPRHLMAGWSALLLLAAAVSASLVRRPWALACTTAVLVAANYFSLRPNRETLHPSPRLIASADRFQFRITNLHRRGREFAAIDAPRKLVIAYGIHPYVVFETIAAAKEYDVRGHDLALDVAVTTHSGQQQQIRSEYLWETPARVRARPGWVIWWIDQNVTVFEPDDPAAPERDSTVPPPAFPFPPR